MSNGPFLDRDTFYTNSSYNPESVYKKVAEIDSDVKDIKQNGVNNVVKKINGVSPDANGNVTINSVSGVSKADLLVEPRKNLFDKVTMTIPNQGINNLGAIGPNTGWEGAKVPVLPNTTYAYKSPDNTYSAVSVGKMAFLDSAGVKISDVDMATLSASNDLTGKKFTTPANTAFVYLNSIVLARNYRDTLQIELGANVTPYEAYSTGLTRVFDSTIVDKQARTDLLSQTSKVDKINFDLYTPENDNTNFGLSSVASTDWYIGGGTAQVKPCTNNYLKSLGIVNWVDFAIGEAITGTTRRDLWFRKKYPTSIKGKYYQMVYYIYLPAGGPTSAFNNSGGFVTDKADGTGFVSITPAEVVITQVPSQANLYKVRKSGVVPSDKEYIEFWIGASFGDVTGTTPALSIGGFYAKTFDASVVGTDAFITSETQIVGLKSLASRTSVLETKVGTGSKLKISKNAVMLGDSITANISTGWTKYMLDKLEFNNYLNLAISGATWSHLNTTVFDTNCGNTGGIAANNVIWNQINKLIDQVNGSAEVASLTVTAIPSTSGNVTITLNGIAVTVALSSSTDTTTDLVATKIRNATYSGWTTGGTGSVVTFTASANGAKTDSTYSAGSTGATGTMSTTRQGYNAGTFPIPDVVAIFSGTNDQGRTQGTAATAFSGSSPITGQNPNTILDIATAVRYSCEALLNAFPDVQIILATPLQRGQDDNTTMFNIGQVIKDCAGYLSVSVIDQGKESGVYGKYDVGTTHKYFSDNLHPNAAGSAKVGAFNATKLRNLIFL